MPLTPPQAAALMDLHLAGVWHDFGQAAPPQHNQLQPPALSAAEQQAVHALHHAPAQLPSVGAGPAPAPAPAASPASLTWLTPCTEQTPAICVAAQELTAPDLLLLHAMLAAVGLAGPAAVAQLTRGADEQALLLAALAPHGHLPVLLLGGAASAALLGQKDPTQATTATKPAGCPAALGSTYHPAFLRANPLYKRAAWGHLRAWQATWAAPAQAG